MAEKRKKRSQMTPLERSIDSREKGISRMKQLQERIRRDAERQVNEISARIKEKQVILDALKAGKLAVRSVSA